MCRACDTVPVHRLLRDTSISSDEVLSHVQEFHDVNLRSPCGKTPLMTAAYCGRKELIEDFVALGCVVHATNEVTGDTAAHYTMLSMIGHVRQCSTFMILLEIGADADCKNFDGYTPIELAQKYGNTLVKTRSKQEEEDEEAAEKNSR